MKISLQMILDRWELPKRTLCICDPYHGFYSGVRLLTTATERLEDGVLYLQIDPIPSTLQFNGNSAVIFYEQPIVCPEMDYGWLETEQNLPDVFNRLLKIFDTYRQYGQRIREALLQPGASQRIVELIAQMVGNPAYVIDRSYRVVAAHMDPDTPSISINWKRVLELGYLPFNVVSSILVNPEWKQLRHETGAVRTITKEFYTPFLACNLRVRGKIYWQFFISELTRRITPGCVDFVNNVSGMLLESLMAGQQPGTAEEKYYSNFFRDVLSGKLTDRQAIAEQLEPLHWPLEGLYCLVELRSEADVDFDDVVFSRMGGNLVCRSVNFENRYLMVFALNSRAAYGEVETQLDKLLVSTGAVGSVSDPFYGFEHLSDHALQTALALPFAGTHGILVRFSSYAVHQLLAGCDVAHKRAACCHILLWLKQLDTQKSFDYYRTLYVYLRHDRNLVQTAAALSIHRNTLVYRLEKLRQLLPLDLEDPDCRFRLLLSYAILEDSTL